MLLLIFLSLVQFAPWTVAEVSGPYATYGNTIGINAERASIIVLRREPTVAGTARTDIASVEQIGNVLIVRANRTENLKTDVIAIFEDSVLKFNVDEGKEETLVIEEGANVLATENIVLNDGRNLGALRVKGTKRAGVIGFYGPGETPLSVRVATEEEVGGTQINLQEARELVSLETQGNILIARPNRPDIETVSVPLILGEETLAFLDITEGEKADVKAVQITEMSQ